MNARIKELADQAFVITTDGKVGHVNTHIVEKFAELMVRQCAEICLEANDHDNILRYFGVDE